MQRNNNSIMIFEIIWGGGGGGETDWVGKEWAGLFFPWGTNGPAGGKLTGGEIPVCYTGKRVFFVGKIHQKMGLVNLLG